jgi:hypothetical protein
VKNWSQGCFVTKNVLSSKIGTDGKSLNSGTGCHRMCLDASSNGSFSPWDALSIGPKVLGTLRYENLGDGLSQGHFDRGRIVSVPGRQGKKAL